MTNQFAEAIAKVQKVAGFDPVAQAMQFAKTPSFIQVGTMQWDIWQAEKKTFFQRLFSASPVAASLCYALASAMEECAHINDFSDVYENNKDEYFSRWFNILLDDYSMVRDSGYFNNHNVDHEQLFDLIAKDIRKFQNGDSIYVRPLSDFVDQLERRTLESLRMDADYFAKLCMQENHTFYTANTIAASLGVEDSTSKEYAIVKKAVWNVYGRYSFQIVDGLTTNLESI